MPLKPGENKTDTTFISEKIKQRPINRKKLLRRTLITVLLAVIFGIVACITFLLLQPVFSDKLYPEKEPEVVSFPEESASDELTPEEMFADDNAIAENEALNNEEKEKSQIDEAIASYSFTASDYGKMVESLKEVSDDVQHCMVKVTALSSDTNWFSESYESSGVASGLIIADTGSNLFILVPSNAVSGASSIRVEFCNGATAEASISLIDTITKQCVISVKRTSLSEATRKEIKSASLGSSNSGQLTGMPVIALGSPIGVQDSMAYGIITSEKTPLNLADSHYKLITTDINGSKQGSGVLVNLKGQVIGIIDLSYNSSDLATNISAIGITELKPLIEDLSNARARSYMGVHGGTVPEDVQKSLNIPAGAYINQTDMSSPAMKAGLQSGDIITKINGYEITTFEQFTGKLAQYSPDDIITVTVMRQAPSDYIEIDIKVTLASSTHN